MTSPLSPEDAAAVLRRAAELDTTALPQVDALDERVVRDAAREVGLSEHAVEQAVQEWRAGVLDPLPELSPDRFAGLLATAAAEGRVALPVERAAEQVDAWLRSQWFERRRTRGPETEWVPRRGVLAGARRAVDVQNRLRLQGVGRVRACVAPAASGTRVRLVADLGDLRRGLLGGLVALPAVVAGGFTVAVGAPDLLPDVLLALPAAAGAGGLGWAGAKGVLRARRARVAEELERVLDELTTMPMRKRLSERALDWAADRLPPQLR